MSGEMSDLGKPDTTRTFPTQCGIACNPLQDGITHINVYTKGATELGTLLTNPANVPVNVYRFGFFPCMEALWYWLTMGCQHNDLRSAPGLKAKSIAREKKYEPTYIPGFEDIIKYITTAKILHNAELRKDFFESTLPFLHYYVYGNPNNPAIRPANGSLWTVQHLELLRSLGDEGSVKWLKDHKKEFRKSVDRICGMIPSAAPGTNAIYTEPA